REFAKLSLSLPNAATVQVSTYNIRGQEVKTESFLYQPNNQDSFNWMAVDRQGEKLPAGIYLLRIKAGTQSKTARVVVIH
ncbi:MAG TPA: FlgD immunoglobulin-like domain containing protein, partial [Candidatus Cloacimonadota bacterium]|nr:FlgD immunoglobulin-like domain containing protein [Candidatus Cloacimonadota bacterium]